MVICPVELPEQRLPLVIKNIMRSCSSESSKIQASSYCHFSSKIVYYQQGSRCLEKPRRLSYGFVPSGTPRRSGFPWTLNRRYGESAASRPLSACNVKWILSKYSPYPSCRLHRHPPLLGQAMACPLELSEQRLPLVLNNIKRG